MAGNQGKHLKSKKVSKKEGIKIARERQKKSSGTGRIKKKYKREAMNILGRGQLLRNTTRINNDKIRDAIEQNIRAGCPLDVAATLAGIHKGTFFRWITIAREVDRKILATPESKIKDLVITEYERYCLEMYDRVEKAQSEHMQRNIVIVEQAAIGSEIKRIEHKDKKGKVTKIETHFQAPQWAAAMTILERRYPSIYGRTDRLAVSAKVESEHRIYIDQNIKVTELNKVLHIIRTIEKRKPRKTPGQKIPVSKKRGRK